MDEARLAGVPLFASLSKKERKRLAQLADEVDVSADKKLIHEGSSSPEFFVIEEGTAAVTRNGDHVADLGPGDFFGEIGAMAHAARTATVTSTSALRAIVMNAHELRQVAKEMPGVAEHLERAIAERANGLGSD